MRRYKLIKATFAAGIVALWGGYADAGEQFSARLSGFQVIGGLGAGETGAILTDAVGTLQLDLDKKAGTIAYTLTYTGPFSSAVTQAHIHFGKVHVAGGIIVWLCQTMAKPSPVPTLTPFCTNTTPGPGTTVTVTGTIAPGSVIGVPGQNVTAGDFDAIEDAITSHTAYANLHTVNFPSGEIRGQIHKGEKEDDHGHGK